MKINEELEKNFSVCVKEILSRVVNVRAKSQDEAIEKVIKLYKSETIILDSSDFQGVEYTTIANNTK